MSAIAINFVTGQSVQFDVSIEGLDDNTPDVRFVISGATVGYDVTLPCEHVDDNTWVVEVPKLPVKKAATLSFKIEIVVDGYYFVPAKGEIKATTGPTVSVKNTKVTAIQTIAAESTSHVDLPISSSSVSSAVDDPSVDAAREVEEVVPVEYIDSTAPHIEELPVVETDEVADYVSQPAELTQLSEMLEASPAPTFNPKDAAQRAIQSVLGGVVVRPERPGSVLTRDAKGRVVGAGVETAEVTQERLERSRRVREMLSH